MIHERFLLFLAITLRGVVLVDVQAGILRLRLDFNDSGDDHGAHTTAHHLNLGSPAGGLHAATMT